MKWTGVIIPGDKPTDLYGDVHVSLNPGLAACSHIMGYTNTRTSADPILRRSMLRS